MRVPDPRVGTELGRYRILSVLGRGGMSVVYLAEHTRLGRKVALKLLATELSEDQGFRDRFLRESRLAASLDHPNVVPIYEADEADGVLFIAMRYVVGTDLKRLIRAHGRLAAERALSILSQIAGALDAAHEAGLVHRDVKPANILIAVLGAGGGIEHAYLADFGLTKRVHADSALTATGQFVGTVDYIAPEQIEGRAVDGRTDVYSFGCVLYEALTGTRPFPLETDVAVLYAHLQRPPPTVSEAGVGLPIALDEVIARAMAKRRENRYPTCGDVIGAAREALGSSPRSPGPTLRKPTVASPGRQPPEAGSGESPEVVSTARGRRGRAAGVDPEQPEQEAPAMPGRRRMALLAGLLGTIVVVAALWILLGLRPGNSPLGGPSPSAPSGSGSPTPTPNPSFARTDVLTFQPFAHGGVINPDQHVTDRLSGSCAGSVLIGRSDAWRCSTTAHAANGSNLFDPCFSPFGGDASEVACPAPYQAPTSIVVIRLTEALPRVRPPSIPPAPDPFLIQLENGSFCSTHSGAGGSVGGTPFRATCSDGAEILEAKGDPNRGTSIGWIYRRGPRWTVQVYREGSSQTTIESVRRAWT